MMDVPVIGVHKLVVIHAVWSVPLHTLNGGLTRVESDDIVDECLSGWR